MKKIKDLNPTIDKWDLSMLVKFNDKQLIMALHSALNALYETYKQTPLNRLSRMFFNSIIMEIENRLIDPKKRKNPKKYTFKRFGKTIDAIINYFGDDSD